MYFIVPQIEYDAAKSKALDLFVAGYRVVSRKHRHVSRVDIPDEEMVKMFISMNYGDVRSGVASCSLELQKDHYRRVYSKDVLALPANEALVLRLLKSLSNE